MCDLWIRNQSKAQLIKIDDIHINDTQVWGNIHWLGDYETKERALEVLDEIQKLLIGDFLVFKNTNFEEGLADYVKPYNAICMEDKHNPTSRVEFIHRDCIMFEMPEK